MGVELAPNAPPAGGLLIGRVIPGSRADDAGLRPWDVISEVDGISDIVNRIEIESLG